MKAIGARAGQYLLTIAVALLGCSCREVTPKAAAPPALTDQQVTVLNALRDEINSFYGFVDGSPRINRGPCGRFARLFHEQWNARFEQKINIVFVMMPGKPDGVGCDHVLVKLPDGSYYDGGGGVMSAAELLKKFRAGDWIDEMKDFDFALLDKRSYSLRRSYELCPNYSDKTTAKIIAKHLDQLPGD
jgi:hypothetical protein